MHNEKKPKVLLVDDEPKILKTMNICFEDMGFSTTQFLDPQDALKQIKKEEFDLAFVDLKMTPIDGIEVLETIKKYSPKTTVVIITAHGSIESAVDAIKKGAHHYLQKPFELIELQIQAQKVLEFHKLKLEVEKLKNENGAGNIVTRNPKMLEMIELSKKVAETDLSVLIEGESGTGKELIAGLIYQNSERVNKPFIKVNCAALPENLLESELFGHVKGAFTGAIKDRKGRFELADGGTIFLDEIAELTPLLQAKLLRVLQQKEFERVGESTTKKVDVRVITATNKNLEICIQNGSFREDLFYRLNSIRIKLPPLKDRPEDIILLIDYFIQKYSPDKNKTLSGDAKKILCNYQWNGNVRELENVIQRAALLAQSNIIELNDLPEEIRKLSNNSTYPLSLEEVEKNHIARVLKRSKDLTEAAQILGIDSATLWRKRKKYNL